MPVPRVEPAVPLTLFNGLSRSIERFVPIDPALVRLYSCGPTVYNHAHIGNLRAYVFTDTLRRTLNWKGWNTNHVINITDVGHLTSDADAGEDKMEVAARAQARSIWEVAARYTATFKADLAALNVLTPTLWSVATDHLQDMIDFARALEARGATYRLPDGLYFDTAAVPDYGRLAGPRGEAAIGRIAELDGKRHPADFAVWRTSPPGARRQMEWQSPWGPGAPGWHLECSVMSLKYLGEQFDIHTGGIDHREIHHPNEIAQNQAYTCSERTGANFWLHNNFVVARGNKMSKSAGSFATLDSLVERGVHPLAYRLLCLAAHYRSELEFSGEAVGAALVRLKRMAHAAAALRAEAGPLPWRGLPGEAKASRGASFGYQRAALEAGLPPRVAARIEAFDRAISADLLLPEALPIVEALLADRHEAPEARLRAAASMDLVIGLDLVDLDRARLSLPPAGAALTAEQVEAALAERQAARARRDFAAADAVRARLNDAGVEVMDGDPLRWEWRPRLDG